MSNVIELFSAEQREEVELRQMEEWLTSPQWPDNPPAAIAAIMAEIGDG
jgi:hypothetical protein